MPEPSSGHHSGLPAILLTVPNSPAGHMAPALHHQKQQGQAGGRPQVPSRRSCSSRPSLPSSVQEPH